MSLIRSYVRLLPLIVLLVPESKGYRAPRELWRQDEEEDWPSITSVPHSGPQRTAWPVSGCSGQPRTVPRPEPINQYYDCGSHPWNASGETGHSM